MKDPQRKPSLPGHSLPPGAATASQAATRLLSRLGLKFFDCDNDDDLDLFLANGNPDDLIETLQKDVTYRWLLLLFHSEARRCTM